MSEREFEEYWWSCIGYAATSGAAILVLIGLFAFVPAVRRRWLPLPRVRPGLWTGRDVVLAFFVFTGFPLVVAMLLFQIGFFTPLIGPPPDTDAPRPVQGIYYGRCSVISSPLGLTVTMAVLLMMMYVRSGARHHHYGLTWARCPANLGLGLASVIVVTPLILSIHKLATSVLGETPNPIIDFARALEHEWEWSFIAFQLVVAAPILEETVFRGLLTGWLQRATLAGHLAVISASVLVGVLRGWFEDAETGGTTDRVLPVVFAFLLAGGYALAMFRLARRFGLHDEEIQDWTPKPGGTPLPENVAWSHETRRQHDETRLDAWRKANARLAVFGAAMLFAMFHVTAWPAPIALFPLALIFGALAQRTQSLIGPIVLHGCFNLVSFIALFGTVHYGTAENGKAATTPATPSGAPAAISIPSSQLPRFK